MTAQIKAFSPSKEIFIVTSFSQGKPKESFQVVMEKIAYDVILSHVNAFYPTLVFWLLTDARPLKLTGLILTFILQNMLFS